ncbi:MAG: CocE/NonD family hydrolase [Bryobacterales bacterium]|nr:CocE/NonD family hydrolase [Bryobacterales bacterium]
MRMLILLFAAALMAQDTRPAPDGFERREVMIPMRDGVRLYTEILTPVSHGGRLPLLMVRTPYDCKAQQKALADRYKELAEDGYIWVFQDIRGKYASEGQFVMIRPPRTSNGGIDEATDAYDTVEWLLHNVPDNNGRAGMMGVSYPGWLTVMAMLDPHPALKAVSPQASPDDMYLGDDFHHNGAFRLSYGFEYVSSLEAGRENKPFEFDKYDVFDWYLSLGPLGNANRRYFHGRFPSWNDFVEHPNFDAFWQRRKASPYLKEVKVPALHVAGWWDQEDFYGPVTIYEALEKHDTRGINYLTVGPWNHGGWMSGKGDSLGNIRFGGNTAEYFRASVLAPWFAYWLKDRGKLNLPEALTFRAGANEWVRHGAWPPKEHTAMRSLYFREGSTLSFDAPAEEGEASDSFVSDPMHPVPYRVRPIPPVYGAGSTWGIWLTDDQRPMHLRPDVLSWESSTLGSDLTLSGQITAKLFASTTQTDADWVVKVIDVYPEKVPDDAKMGGYQLMVANDVFRGRFHNSFERPEPLTPGRVTEFTIDLHTQDYRFLEGHRIMVQVQSTWFPLIDRNPQRYTANIFDAKESDFVKATHRVYRSARHASRVEIQVEQ